MSIPIAQKPKKLEMLIINDEAETPSLLNPTSGQIFVTNPVGKRLIELADGSRTLEQIVEELSGEFADADPSDVYADARTFFETSTEKGLVTWTS